MEQKNGHEKKLAAPIIITFFVVCYYLGIALVWMSLPKLPFLVKFLPAFIPIALAGAAIAMFWERICEIRSGEEDDLSQY